MELAVVVAAVAFDIDQRLPVAEAQDQVAKEARKVRLHPQSPFLLSPHRKKRFGADRAFQCTTPAAGRGSLAQDNASGSA